jgi:hypothetical protein
MDLSHLPNHHVPKRRRLDEAPGSRAKPVEGQIEEPHLQISWPPSNQAAFNSHLALYAGQQNLPVSASYAPSAIVSSGFEFRSMSFDSNGGLNNHASQSYETQSLTGGDPYKIQPTTACYQSDLFNHHSLTYSRPVNFLTPPPTLLPHHAISPQQAHAHPLTTPYHTYSFQVPHIPQKPSEPSSVQTLPPAILNGKAGIQSFDESTLSASVQLDKDRGEMVCFGMVSIYILPHKAILANFRRSRPSLVGVSGKVHAKFHHHFQSN